VASATDSLSSSCRHIYPSWALARFQIGIVASAALLGTAAVTLAIGFLAPSRDLRNLLLVGAFATVATGIAFQATEQFALILVIAFVGTMNPSSRDIGLFVPLEHAMLARARMKTRPA
jgi:hypothetical protein